MKVLNSKGFTLVEVIVGGIVISLISLVTWMAVTVLTKTGEISRNRLTAVNLLQQSQEEVRRIAQLDTVYNTLDTCQFPDPSNPPANTCGFADISVSFPGFRRIMAVSNENGSTELKRVLTTVQWTEFNQPKEIQSLILLSRPPDPLPGNIIGSVTSQGQPSDALNGVTITVEIINATASYATTSSGVIEANGANFNFADVDTGRFILPAGNYTLKAASDGFFPYIHPTTVTVPSNGEVFVILLLEPRPEDAIVMGNVIDQSTGNPLNSFSGGRIRMYDDGSQIGGNNGQKNYSFTVSFDDSIPKEVTLNTQRAYRVGFTYLVGSGGAPSCIYEYNREGFSSAVVQDDSSLVCTNSYNGNNAADRVNILPGSTTNFDIPLVPVPEVTITGRVRDSQGNPLIGATVRADWPDGGDWRKQGVLQTVLSQAPDGRFSYRVPAVQGMWRNGGTGDFLRVWARASVSVLTCCDIVRNEQRNSPVRRVGPLFPLDSSRDIGDLVIDVTDEECGNVEGDMTDDLSSNNLPGVNVTISTTQPTDAMGHYIIECPAGQSDYRLEVNNYRFRASKSGYYTNDSRGNAQYTRRSSGGRDVSILADTIINYDARLWPRGFGNIEVNVVDQTTGSPMDGVDVVFNPYFGSDIVQTTSSGGKVNLNQVSETWPPPSPLLPSDGYYQTSSRNHTIEINHDPANYLSHTETISDFHAGDTLIITIMLKRIGGV